MNYSLHQGIETIREAMTDYAARYGARFEPVEGWSRVVEQSGTD
jgi:hypothetical protein